MKRVFYELVYHFELLRGTRKRLIFYPSLAAKKPIYSYDILPVNEALCTSLTGRTMFPLFSMMDI